MLSNEVIRMEQENIKLKAALKEMTERMEGNETPKPKSCAYCKNYLQHYIKDGNRYSKTYCGHCVAGRRIKDRKPDNSCDYFELGTHETKHWV